MLSRQDAQQALNNSEIIFTEQQVQAAVSRMAQEINAAMAELHPLVLSVMGGAVVFTGQLLPQLSFPLDFDYVHVSRYGNSQQGGEMKWKVAPQENVRGRIVLVVDDILDEGETMHAVRERVLALGASGFYSAIFADKLNGKTKPIRPDFTGLQVPDRFVFGYGMDIHGAWRNLPAIYATKESQ
ncbi:MAG: hypoxanthine-guanine phosphoribosyltransferase [Gallionellaceae bacterium]|nr:hypoxanthine-guanine phosphoribosyltransferase [Gallionellaceae bacterium]